MPDVFTKAKRSDVMSRIRSRGNRATELALVRVFRAHGIPGWRRHLPIRIAERGTRKGRGVRAAGSSFRTPHSALRVFSVRPDFVFPKLRLAVFVDGCFWHACPLHATKPKDNAAFWRKKFARNQTRDRLVTRTLRKAGWRVLRIWEHTLKKRGRRRAERGIQKSKRASTPHPGPLPFRGGEGAEARLVARVRRALAT